MWYRLISSELNGPLLHNALVQRDVDHMQTIVVNAAAVAEYSPLLYDI